MITKLDAAKRQLERAIHLLDEDDLSAHTLAFAAYCLLRDLIGPGALMDAIKGVEKALNISEIPHFLKHGDHHPEAILKEHSPETAHTTMALAIRLWKENGYEPTITMSEFSRRPNPYEPGKRHRRAR
jgi:hypothetical protein